MISLHIVLRPANLVPSPMQFIITNDGSHSLLNTELNETYHSVHGAVQESVHVFIKMGLELLIDHGLKNISILEIGFGTGLNALLTVRESLKHPDLTIQYTSLEAYPLPEEIWSKLNYTDSIGLKEYFQKLHQSNWNIPEQILPNFTLFKQQQTFQQVVFESNKIDLIYYDAFAPSKQPELWTMEMLSKVVSTLKQKGVFVTYCAKGQLKRDLKALGFTVETLEGPPGKKEMVRAVKD